MEDPEKDGQNMSQRMVW